jgi:hypothetical protein
VNGQSIGAECFQMSKYSASCRASGGRRPHEDHLLNPPQNGQLPAQLPLWNNL